MTRYEIQAKFGKQWILLETKDRHSDALHYVKEHVGETYKMRVVRVVRTVVLEDK